MLGTLDATHVQVHEPFAWTDAAIARLRLLAAEPNSAREISEILSVEFRAPISRSAVMGKCFRLGIMLCGSKTVAPRGPIVDEVLRLESEGVTRRQIVQQTRLSYRQVAAILGPLPPEQASAAGVKRASQSGARLGGLIRAGTKKKKAKTPSWFCTEDVEITTGLLPGRAGVLFADLNAFHCRWPVGDPRSPDMRYCGEPKHGTHSYCTAHCRAAYTVPAERDSLSEAA